MTSQGWGWGSVVEHLQGMSKALGLCQPWHLTECHRFTHAGFTKDFRGCWFHLLVAELRKLESQRRAVTQPVEVFLDVELALEPEYPGFLPFCLAVV